MCYGIQLPWQQSVSQDDARNHLSTVALLLLPLKCVYAIGSSTRVQRPFSHNKTRFAIFKKPVQSNSISAVKQDFETGLN